MGNVKESPYLRTNGEIILGNLEQEERDARRTAVAQQELTTMSSRWIVDVIGSQDQDTGSEI